MRECAVLSLVLLCCPPLFPQSAPTGWKVVQDAKANCQVAVPPDWVAFGDNSGAAVFHDSSTAIVVVTSQPGQEFKPLTPSFVKGMGIAKEKMFENSPKRIFYQDKVSKRAEDTNAYSSSVPATTGTCSCHLVFVPAVTENIAKTIVMSLSAVAPKS